MFVNGRSGDRFTQIAETAVFAGKQVATKLGRSSASHRRRRIASKTADSRQPGCVVCQKRRNAHYGAWFFKLSLHLTFFVANDVVDVVRLPLSSSEKLRHCTYRRSPQCVFASCSVLTRRPHHRVLVAKPRQICPKIDLGIEALTRLGFLRADGHELGEAGTLLVVQP